MLVCAAEQNVAHEVLDRVLPDLNERRSEVKTDLRVILALNISYLMKLFSVNQSFLDHLLVNVKEG